jgi:hypothetical protein
MIIESFQTYFDPRRDYACLIIDRFLPEDQRRDMSIAYKLSIWSFTIIEGNYIDRVLNK